MIAKGIAVVMIVAACTVVATVSIFQWLTYFIYGVKE